MTIARFCRGTAIAGCAMLLALMLPAVASAHAFLVSSSPQAGERLPASPRTLALQFTEQVASLGSDHLTVETATRRPVAIGAIRLSAGSTELVAVLPRLSSGIYIVTWDVVSSDDGHPSTGQFAFAVGTSGRLPALVASSSAPTDWADAIAEWLLLLGLAVSAGGLVSSLAIWQPLSRGQNWNVPPMPLIVPLLIAFAASVTLLVRFVGSLHVGGAAALADPNIVTQVAGTRVGVLSLVTCALILYALFTSFVSRWRYAALLALILAALAVALRSHPAATSSWWGAPAIAIHLALAILWTGALLQLVLVFWRQHAEMPREAMIAGVRRYASFALWSAIVVLLSGLGAALSEFTSVNELATTSYGLLLLLKAVLVLTALFLALVVRTDALSRPLTTAVSMLRGVTPVEGGLLIAVLAVSALLTNVAPPFAAPAARASVANSLLGPPPPVGPALTLAGKAGWLEVYVTAGANLLMVQVVTPNDEAPRAVDLHLEAERPYTAERIDLFPRTCGTGCYNMHFRWSRGPTRLQVHVNTAEWRGGNLSFVVPWPPLPLLRHGLAKVIARMQAQPSLILTERTSSAPNTSFVHTLRASGRQFIASEPYGAGVPAVRPLPARRGERQWVLYLSGSDIWVHLWIDRRYRILREVIVDPGHLIRRTFSYPGG